MKTIVNRWYAWIGLLVAIVIFIVAQEYYTAMLAYANFIVYAALGIFLLHFLDDKFTKGVDTHEEIVVKQNYAYAIYMLCLTLIICVAVIASILPFVFLQISGQAAG